VHPRERLGEAGSVRERAQRVRDRGPVRQPKLDRVAARALAQYREQPYRHGHDAKASGAPALVIASGATQEHITSGLRGWMMQP
jgi:hypothetical protein